MVAKLQTTRQLTLKIKGGEKHLSVTENRNPAARKLLILSSVDNSIAKISLYAIPRLINISNRGGINTTADSDQ